METVTRMDCFVSVPPFLCERKCSEKGGTGFILNPAVTANKWTESYIVHTRNIGDICLLEISPLYAYWKSIL